MPHPPHQHPAYQLLKKVYWLYKGTNLRGLFLSLKYPQIKLPFKAHKGCILRNLKNAKIQKSCIIYDHVDIFINRINQTIPQLIFGERVHIGRYSSIGCSNKIILEDDVLLAPFVHITDRNHTFEDIKVPIRSQKAISPGPVVIGKGTWLGYAVQIMPGIKIGRQCVIGAGSIVTQDIPDYSVAVGSPARVIKRYNLEKEEWEKV